MGKFGDTRAVEPLTVMFRDTLKMREAAVQAIVKIGKPAGNSLLNALHSPQGYIRKMTAEVLDKIEWQPVNANQRASYAVAKQNWDDAIREGVAAVEPLRIALRRDVGSGVNIQIAAVRALKEIGGTPAVAALTAALSDEDFVVRAKTVEALAEIGNAEAVTALTTAFKDKEIKAAAVEALAKIGKPALSSLCLVLRTPDREQEGYAQSIAAKAIVKTGDAEAIEPLISMLNDSNIDIRTGGINVLNELLKNQAVVSEANPTDLHNLANVTNTTRKIVLSRQEGCDGFGDYFTYGTEEVDLSFIRQVARQELIRRGENA